jgi:hydrogenase/urease accessory protein HupE
MVSGFKKVAVAAALVAGSSVPALAHPGEHAGSFGETIVHMLSNWDHSTLLALALLAVVAVGFSVRALRRQR